jgi:hypothetical protein
VQDANSVKSLKICSTFIETGTTYVIYQHHRLVNSFILSFSIKVLFIFRCNTQKSAIFGFFKRF